MRETKFKHTAIGTIPQEWETKTLEEVCEYISDGDHLPPPKTKSGVPFITISDINKSTHLIDFSQTAFVSRSYYNSIKNEKKAKLGDILYTVTGSYGIPIMVKDNIKFCFQRHIALLRPSCCISTKYLYFALNGDMLLKQADDAATGVAQKTISLSSLNNISIPFPPTVWEQNRIATALMDMDELIQDLQKLITKKQNIKSGTMQLLLSGKKRLSGFNKPWEKIQMPKLATVSKGKGLSKAKLSPNGRYKCMLYGEIFTTYNYVMDECISHTDFFEGTLSNNGDVVLPASTTTCGRDLAKAVAINEEGILLGGDIIILRNSYGKFFANFLAPLITELYKDQIEEVAHGVTIVHLTTKNIGKFSFFIPSDLDEQRAIAKVLTDMDDEIQMLQTRLQKYINLKQGMMQQLLTGKIRLI